MSSFKVLVLFTDEEHQKSFDKISGLKSDYSEIVFKRCSFEQFQDGKRFDTFDAVLAFTPNVSDDDFEMQSDFWEYYSIAPVFGVLHKECSAARAKELLSGSAICIESNSEETYAADLKSMI